MADSPQFRHHCDDCQFIGRFLEHDVYLCRAVKKYPTIIARSGDDRTDYTTVAIPEVKEQLSGAAEIENVATGEKKAFSDYVFDENCPTDYQAAMLGLAMLGLRRLQAQYEELRKAQEQKDEQAAKQDDENSVRKES